MTYFISGHRDITHYEFTEWYVPEIRKVILSDPYYQFVVGDCEGVDELVQEYIPKLGIDPLRVTVYHMHESPRVFLDHRCTLVGGFKSDEERDAAMTADSNEDIAFIRKGKESSGTAQNILRRLTRE